MGTPLSLPPQTVQDVLNRLPNAHLSKNDSLRAPSYSPLSVTTQDFCLAVESMRRHMTDEGWQLVAGLEAAGYMLVSPKLRGPKQFPTNDVGELLKVHTPNTLFIQDKREWDGLTAGPGFDQDERFQNIHLLRDRHDVFKVTVLKDAQNDLGYNERFCGEIGVHAWACYYHPRIVAKLAPYVRPHHLIRTYHTLDRDVVPKYDPVAHRDGTVLTGALSAAYPLRQKLALRVRNHTLQGITCLKHPGYGRDGCHTPQFLRQLSSYKVSLCTSSKYGYALRKIVESTACGCVVVTDLPVDDQLPMIEGNLIRVHPDCDLDELGALCMNLCRDYDPDKQRDYAARATVYYDYRMEGARLATRIEELRRTYNG